MEIPSDQKSPNTELNITEDQLDSEQSELPRDWISHEQSIVSEIDDTGTQLVEFVQGEVFESDPSSTGSIGTHSHYVQQIVHIRSSPHSPGETVRVIRVPVSVLASNLQSLEEHHRHNQQELLPSTEIINRIIQGENLQSDESLQQTQPPTDINPIEIPENPITKVEDNNDSLVPDGNPAMEVEDTSVKRRFNIRKRRQRLNITENISSKSMQHEDDENKRPSNNAQPVVEREKTPPPPPPEPFPVDKCANCMTLFQNETQKFKTVCRTTGSTSEESSEVSIVEALHVIFNIPNEFKKDHDECFLCKKCIEVIRILYSAFKDFADLTKEDAYVLRKLKEIEESSKKGKRRGRQRKINASSPSPDDQHLGYSEIKAEVEWDEEVDEEDDAWMDFSDDEDFQASEADLAAVGVESSSSSSEDELYIPVKKKKILSTKKSRKSRNALDENFFWGDEIKREHLSSDDEFETKRRRKSRTRHKKSMLNGLTYLCNLCDAPFLKPRELKSHLQEFHKKTHRSFDALETKQEEEGDLEGGELPTIPEDMKAEDCVCICRICAKELGSNNELKNHFAEEHEEQLPFLCEKCDRQFGEISALRRHEITHSVERPYKCRICRDVSFRRADELRSHWAEEHVYGGDDDENTSDAPSPRKKENSSLGNKTKKGKSKAVVPCDVCGKAFVRHDHLKLHMRIHTGEKPFTCTVCGKAFSDPRGLAYHEVTHSNERPYCCTICGVTFKRLHHLNDHERNHREDIERPFSCTTCGKCFKYKKHLNSHMVIHANSKDHQCEICGKSFNRKDNLRQHVKKVHGKEPGPSTMSSVAGTSQLTSSTNNTSIVTATIPIEPTLDTIVYMSL